LTEDAGAWVISDISADEITAALLIEARDQMVLMHFFPEKLGSYQGGNCSHQVSIFSKGKLLT